MIVDLRFHVCREACANRKVVLKYCSTTTMMADTPSKSLGLNKSETIKPVICLATSALRTVMQGMQKFESEGLG